MFSKILLSVSLIASAVASHDVRLASRHSLLSRKLSKRDGGYRFTYFADGLGACGHYNQPSDFIVALNSAQYDGGSHCHQTITISANGKTARATVMDECPGCPYEGLDFSEGLFQYFADLSVGVLYGSWYFDGGYDAAGNGPNQGSPAPPPSSSKHTSTSTWTPPLSSTKHSSTSTWSSSKTTSTSSKVSSSTTSSTTKVTTTSTSKTTSTPTSTPTTSPSTIQSMNQAFIGISSLVVSAA